MESQRKKWKLQCLINSNNKNLVPSCISEKKSKEKVKSGTSHSTKSLKATGVPLEAGMVRSGRMQGGSRKVKQKGCRSSQKCAGRGSHM